MEYTEYTRTHTRIKKHMIAIIGCGTLGSKVAHLLKQEELLLIDHDVVHEENLAYQQFSRKDVGTQKVYALLRVIPHARTHNTFLDEINIELLRNASVVVDCTDNLYTRLVLDRYCVQNGISLVHAAAGTKRGIVGRFTQKKCLRSVYKNKISVENCRGREIEHELANLLAQTQASLATEVLQGKEEFYLALVDKTVTPITLAEQKGTCEEQETPKPYYVTWCEQEGCLSAKPKKNYLTTQREEIIQQQRVRIQPNGEIYVYDTEDIDVVEDIARRIYEKEILGSTPSTNSTS